MQLRSRLVLVIVVTAPLVLGVACASKGDLEKAQQGLASTQEELTKAKADQVAAAQRLAAMEDQFKSAQAEGQQAAKRLEDADKTLKDSLASAQRDLDVATKDVTTLKSSLGTLQGDQAKLKSDVTSTTADVPRLKTDLSSTTASLNDLKGSFLLTRDDVTKLREDVTTVQQTLTKPTPTPNPRAIRASYAILALNLYTLAKEVNDAASYRTAALRVGAVVSVAGDATLSDAWKKLDVAWNALVATTPNTPERDAASRDWGTSETAFLLRLLQLITG